ncbi:MAG: hypothetical protein WC915_02440 [archaeon]|jgi:hypothetical protein
MFKKSNAQGTIEYLVIISIVVVIALVVVSMLMNLSSVSGVDVSSSKLLWTAQPVGVNDAGADESGNAFFVVTNNTDDYITLTGYRVNGVTKDFDVDGTRPIINSGDKKVVFVAGQDACQGSFCSFDDLSITYTSKHGLLKSTETNDLLVERQDNLSVLNFAGSALVCVNNSEVGICGDGGSGPGSDTNWQTSFSQLDTNLSNYFFKIDGSNNPITGDLNIYKTDPEVRLTDSGSGEYVRLTKTNTDNEFSILNRVSVIPDNTIYYPLAQSGTYVKATTIFSTSYYPYYATDPTKSLIDSWSGSAWVASTNINQAFHIDLGSAYAINKIYYENGHNWGAPTQGVKDFTLWGSNSAEAFADTTYATDTSWTQITDGMSQTYFDQHVSSNIPDPKYITFSQTPVYRYYRLKFVNGWGGAQIALKRISLISSLPFTTEINTITSLDSSESNEYGIQTFGDEDGRTVIEGQSTRFNNQGVEQLNLVDGKLAPTTDNDVNLGDSTHAFKEINIAPNYDSGVMVGGTATGGYVDRGDPSNWDFTTTDFIADSAWHDLDLSAIVPAGAKAVSIKLYVDKTVANRVVSLRKKGNTNTIAGITINTQSASFGIYGNGIVGCDSDQVVEYYAQSGAWPTFNLVVTGWFI